MSLHRSVSLAALALIVAAPMPRALASGYSVLWNFKQAAYGNPDGRLLWYDGALFGTTSGGQASGGSAFQLTESGNSWSGKLLAAFNGSKGEHPYAGLVRGQDGAYYGTTAFGGANNDGTVFKLSQSNGKWVLSVIHSFGATGDGVGPACDLVLVPSTGTLIGTTESGGANGAGTAFTLTYSGGAWKESVLYSFTGLDDGRAPEAGLHRDSSGVLYGTASYAGANGIGVFFELRNGHGGWKETILHAFANGSDGAVPYSQPIADSSGALYGTTYYGGPYSSGTVFKFAQSGGKWQETVLWSFKGGTADGANPQAGLHMDPSGALYGTTFQGGSYNYGTLFELSPGGGGWTEAVLHSFGGSNDGRYPAEEPIADSAGNLYGTTDVGGQYTYGTVFKFTP